MDNENVLNGGVSTQASTTEPISNVNISSGDSNTIKSENLQKLATAGDSATVTLDSTYTGNIYRISDRQWSGFIPNGEFLWHIDITDGKVTTHEVFVQNARYETLGTESLTIDGAIKELKENEGVNTVTLVDSEGSSDNKTVKVSGNLNFYSPYAMKDIRDCGYLPVTKISKHPISGETLAYDLFGVKFSDSLFIKSLGGSTGKIEIDTAPTDFGNIKFKMDISDNSPTTAVLTGTVQGVDKICKVVTFEYSDMESTIPAEKLNDLLYGKGRVAVYVHNSTDELYYPATYGVIKGDTIVQFSISIDIDKDMTIKKWLITTTIASDGSIGAGKSLSSKNYSYKPTGVYSLSSANPLTSIGVYNAINYPGVKTETSTSVSSELNSSSEHRIIVCSYGGTQIYTLPIYPKNGEKFEFYKIYANTLVIKTGSSTTSKIWDCNSNSTISSRTVGTSTTGRITAIYSDTTSRWLLMIDAFLAIS